MLVQRKRGADSHVNYARLRQAEQLVAERHPSATRVRALWTPSNADADVHVEVWHGRRAEVVRP